jgi:hypothetical protein
MRVVHVALVAFAAVGCGLRARNHPCYPFLDHHFHGHVPKEVLKELAHDRGAMRVVHGHRSPIGAYWRRRRSSGDQAGVHEVMGDYELAPCPGLHILPPRPPQ